MARCSDAAIAGAAGRTGQAELADPSCPAASEIGHVLAGAGTGTALTFVPGKLYLAGPFEGAPLSVVAIVPAVAGPFDVGTVLTREAIDLNPVTYRGEIHGSPSNPFPQMLDGIPLRLKDLRLYVDRSGFMRNPTSCDPTETAASVFGTTAEAALTVRYQAASCASLPFAPRLSLTLSGKTTRAATPTAVGADAACGRRQYRSRGGDAAA